MKDAKHRMPETSKKILLMGPFSFASLNNRRINQYNIQGMGGVPVVNQYHSLVKYSPFVVDLLTFTDEIQPGRVIKVKHGKSVIHIIGIRPHHGLLDLCRKEISVAKSTLSERYEFVIANYTVEYSLIALRLSIPHIIILHDNPLKILKQYKYHPYWALRYLVSKYIILKGNKFLAVNEYVRDNNKISSLDRISILGNPLSLKHSNTSIAEFKNKDNSKFIISSVISWGNLKNAKTALKAFALFQAKYNNATYLLIGPGLEYKGSAYIWAEENGLLENVRFLGRINNDDVYSLINQSQLYFHPSFEEAASMVISEAMYLQVPILAGLNSGGVPCQLGYGKYGVLVDIQDEYLIDKEIRHIASHYEGYSKMISDAKAAVLKKNQPYVFSQGIIKYAK